MSDRPSSATDHEPRERSTGVLLLALGVLTLGAGVYFLAFRPPMLPEDIRFSGVDPMTLPSRTRDWLGLVFRTLGGFIAGFGILLSGLGAKAFTGSADWQRWGLGIALLVAFGRFLASNLALQSDFLWFVALQFALAASVAGWMVVRRVRGRSPHEP
jgi:hypothetical protein